MSDFQKLSKADVWVGELVVTNIERRGRGVDGDPIRIIRTVYTKGGEFVAEYDVQGTQQDKDN